MTALVVAHGGSVGLVLEFALLALPLGGMVVLWVIQRRLPPDDDEEDGAEQPPRAQ